MEYYNEMVDLINDLKDEENEKDFPNEDRLFLLDEMYESLSRLQDLL